VTNQKILLLRKEDPLMRATTAFTLIELLVVITIIVVLLALLVPALDRAIYQAHLLQCGAKIKAGVDGGSQYAFGNRRYYPTHSWHGGHIPNWVRYPGLFDFPKDLRSYVGLEVFYDPLAEEIDLSEAANDPDAILLATNGWLFDWARPDTDPNVQWDGIKRVIKRVGDRLVYDPIEDRGNVRTFSVLVTDLDIRVQGNGGVIIEHPDPNGGVPPEKYQNEAYITRLPVLPVFGKITLFWWIGGSSNMPNRGRLDLNYGYMDGSVLRLNDVGIHDPTFPTPISDDRVWGVIASSDMATRQQQLPRE